MFFRANDLHRQVKYNFNRAFSTCFFFDRFSMGRRRKGVGAIRGSKKKRQKVHKDWEEEDNDAGIRAMKMSCRTIVRPEYRDVVLPWLAKISIETTKICELASLLFLQKVRQAYEVANWIFFMDGDGVHVIESCFYAVLMQNKESEDMVADFRHQFEAVDGQNRQPWPKNQYFGNHFAYTMQQYVRNVVTNLTTHAGKRVTEFLKLVIWLHNSNHPDDQFNEYDIKNAVNWAIRRFDSTGNRADKAEKLNRRDRLLLQLREYCVPELRPVDDNFGTYTKTKWFASIPFWLFMQSEIANYHDNMENYIQGGVDPPIVKNLAVIPICSHLRKPVKMDADVLYRMMCDTKIIPKDERGCQVTGAHVCQNKEYYFAQIFNMEKINRKLKANKEFHYHVLSDGVSASILYKIRQEIPQQIDDECTKNRYDDGFFHYELGIDPGMKTWNATVRRNIDTGKEVSIWYFI